MQEKPAKKSMSKHFHDLISLYQDQIAQVIPQHLNVERVIQVATTVFTRTPELHNCDPASVVGAVMQSSILGLDPTPQLGQCYFVPYKNKKTGRLEAQFQLGYRGLIALARRSGEVSVIYAYPVYENDEFEMELGLNPKIIHKPAMENRGKLRYAYAVIKLKDGGIYFEVMTKEDIYHIKAKSKAKDSPYSPWNTDESEMWRKTVLKRALKFAPLAVEYQKAIEADSSVIKPESFNQYTKEIDFAKVEKDYEEPEESETVLDPEKEVKQKEEPVKESETKETLFK